MALMLGIRHGFDLDHLATIDSVTRNTADRQSLSRVVGLLFSLGHGLVVISISLIIGSGITTSNTPEWLNGFGEYISIFFLILFGILNLLKIFQSNLGQALPTSLRNYAKNKITEKKLNPIFVILIGALFAFSFDTFSQIALFSLAASALAGCLFAGLLGLVFMFGMMVTDGLNGYFVSSIIQGANNRSLFVSNLVSFIIAAFSLILATYSIFRMSQ